MTVISKLGNTKDPEGFWTKHGRSLRKSKQTKDGCDAMWCLSL